MAFRNKIKSIILICIFLLIFLSAGAFYLTGYLLPNRPAVPFTENDQYVLVNNARIRYQVYQPATATTNQSDNKSVLILLHGFGNYKEQWKKVIPHLSYDRIIGLDMIGFGGSDTPEVTFSLETQRQFLLGFMDALHIDKATLAGISMGASVSAWTAAFSKDRIERIVLIAPSGYPGSLTKDWPYNWIYRPGFVNRTFSLIVSSKLFKSTFPDSMGAQAIDVTNTYNSDFTAALENITQPVLLVWSKGDKTTPFQYAKEYINRIKILEFVEVPEQHGHSILRHAPETIAEIINKFINSSDKTHTD